MSPWPPIRWHTSLCTNCSFCFVYVHVEIQPCSSVTKCLEIVHSCEHKVCLKGLHRMKYFPSSASIATPAPLLCLHPLRYIVPCQSVSKCLDNVCSCEQKCVSMASIGWHASHRQKVSLDTHPFCFVHAHLKMDKRSFCVKASSEASVASITDSEPSAFPYFNLHTPQQSSTERKVLLRSLL